MIANFDRLALCYEQNLIPDSIRRCRVMTLLRLSLQVIEDHDREQKGADRLERRMRILEQDNEEVIECSQPF